MAGRANKSTILLAVFGSAVRDLLSSSHAFHSLPEEDRKAAAQAMVKVCQTAVSLAQEEAKADLEVESGKGSPRLRGIVQAQSAGSSSAEFPRRRLQAPRATF